MNEKDGLFQSAGETAVEMFAAKLQRPSTYGHHGFNDMNKAMDPSLAEREELNLGYMSDKELAAEIDTLNGYLREEREMYERGSHFFNILDGAQQRIRHLSKRLERALGKEVFDPEANVQIVGRLKSPMEQSFDELLAHSDERDVKWEDLVSPAAFICADGAGIEQAPSFKVSDAIGSDFVGDHQYATVTLDSPTQAAGPNPGDEVDIQGVSPGNAILGNGSVMVSRGFGVTWCDLSKNMRDRAEMFTRINVLVDRLCFHMGVMRSDKLSVLVNKIIKAHPDLEDDVVLHCFEVANPGFLGASHETLTKAYTNWLNLVEIVNPRPSAAKGK